MINESKLIGTKVTMPYGWREFKVGDLFDVLLSSGDNKISDLPKGDIPLITSGASNNGIAGLVAFGDGDAQLFDKGVLTADMFGNVLFQPKAFYAVSHGRVNVLKPIDDGATMLSLLFIASFIKKQTIGRYGFDYMLSSTRLHDLSIELPVIQDGQPDYGWMASYIRELENQRIRELDTYLQVTGLDNTTLTDDELQALEQWRQHEKFGGTLLTKRFKVDELFELENSPVNNANDLLVGKVSAGEGLYGVSDMITTDFYDNYIITISKLGQTFYHTQNVTWTDDVLGLKLKYRNDMVGLFLSTIIDKQSRRISSYGHQFRMKRLHELSIELPVTNDDTPDYDFMQTFVRAQEKLVMQRLDKFRQLQIDTTRQII